MKNHQLLWLTFNILAASAIVRSPQAEFSVGIGVLMAIWHLLFMVLGDD